ncbi:MAG TPA: TolC family protein [Chitinophagaceae bacterium]|nr:TolC family protein [Chitinophagaceae bacterium]
MELSTLKKTAAQIFLCVLLGTPAFSQPVQKWDLRKCVEYAILNNISVKQADLQVRFANLDFLQSKSAKQPTANFNGNLGYSAGRNQDPTTFSLITTGYWFNSYSLQAGIDLFNWFTKKNTVAVKELDLRASEAGFEKAKNDISLNVAVAYLQVLLAREQTNLSRVQVGQTLAQLDITRKQVDAGNLPELSAAQVESQLATDSSNLIAAETSSQQLLLQLKALLNLDAALPFDIESPPVELVPVESLADLQPDAVYALAMKNMPQQRMDEIKLNSARKSVEVARGSMYPTISLFGSLGSTFNNKARAVISKTQVNTPIGNVTVNGSSYQVFPVSPFDFFTYGKQGYFSQLNQNFRQSVGLSVSVPILNGGSLRTNWERSKLTVKQVELENESNSMTLKQDIYKAYTDAVAAVQKFNASKKSVETALKAYDFGKKRYDLGLLSTFELLNLQNALQTAKTQLLYVQYDYVFKLKLLEFQRGQGLKL